MLSTTTTSMLTIPETVTLLTTGTVCALTGKSRGEIHSMVECGEIRWVANVSPSRDRDRALRFWRVSIERLIDGDDQPDCDPDEVAGLLTRHLDDELTVLDVERFLGVCTSSAYRLVRAGAFGGERGDGILITRGALAAFLASRLGG